MTVAGDGAVRVAGWVVRRAGAPVVRRLLGLGDGKSGGGRGGSKSSSRDGGGADDGSGPKTGTDVVPRGAHSLGKWGRPGSLKCSTAPATSHDSR